MELLLILIGVSALCFSLKSRARIARLERDLSALREWISKSVPLADSQAETSDAAGPEASTRQSPWDLVVRKDRTQPGDMSSSVATDPVEPDREKGVLAWLQPWLRDNWIYPVAGAALVLSGVFLVQYAIESGLLTDA